MFSINKKVFKLVYLIKIMKKENQVILDLLRFSFNKKLKTKIKSSLNKELDWNYILQTAKRHSISSIIYKTLKNINFENQVIKEFEKNYYNTHFKNSLLYKELDNILKVFKKENIDAILLKGIYLAKNLYKDIGLRPMGDIDLLVKKEDLTRIFPIFDKRGYNRRIRKDDNQKQYIKIYKSTEYTHIQFIKGFLCIELHTTPIEQGLPYKGNFNKFWKDYKKNRENFDIVFLSTHLHIHAFTRLIWFYDILLLIKSKKISWNTVYKISKIQGVNLSVYNSLNFLYQTFSEDKAKKILEKLNPNWLKKKIYKKIWKVDKNFPFSSKDTPEKLKFFYFNLFSIEKTFVDFSFFSIIINMILMGRTKEKMKYIFDYIFPTKKYMNINYNINNSVLVFFCYFYRPFDMILKYIKIKNNSKKMNKEII